MTTGSKVQGSDIELFRLQNMEFLHYFLLLPTLRCRKRVGAESICNILDELGRTSAVIDV